MDFNITEYGDIIKDDDAIIDFDKYRVQLAKSRIVSIDKDWYWDNIGANIEELFGAFVTPNATECIFTDKIKNALLIDDVFNNNNIYIECEYDYEIMSLESKIFIKNLSFTTDTKSELIKINLDLFNSELIF